MIKEKSWLNFNSISVTVETCVVYELVDLAFLFARPLIGLRFVSRLEGLLGLVEWFVSDALRMQTRYRSD